MDKFYTPGFVSDNLLAAIESKRFEYLIDFAAGRGALLAPAANRWPTARVVANDRDWRVAAFLERSHPRWNVLCSDFLTSTNSRLIRAVRSAAGKQSLVLLNPPFTCRGAKRHSAQVAGRTITCSLAVAFVLRAIPAADFVGSEMACVLPSGSLASQKDVEAWEYVRRRFELEVIASYERFTFSGCHPRTTIIRLVRKVSDEAIDITSATSHSGHLSQLIRGWVQMHTRELRLGRRCLRLIHTTDLQQGQAMLSNDWVWTDRHVSGPALLIPRVGQPRPDKIVVWGGTEDIALSDCVVALRTTSVEAAVSIQKIVLQHWPNLETCYTGTGARYITLQKLVVFLRGIIQASDSSY